MHAKSKKSTVHQGLFMALILLFLQSGCKERRPAASPPTTTTISLDSSLGIGRKIRFFSLPGRIIAFNPDSANKIIIVRQDGQIIHTIHRNNDSTGLPRLLNKVAVDSSTMEVYIYSPHQHQIFVYDTAGDYKSSIFIQQVHTGGFARGGGEFIFWDDTK
jgi:hypothetical protein